METTKAGLTLTLAPVLAGMIANELARRNQKLDLGEFREPLITAKEIEQVINEACEEQPLQDILAPKHWTKSRTVVAGLSVAALSAFGFVGPVVETQDVAEIVNHLDALLLAVLGLVSAYGRIKARKAIA